MRKILLMAFLTLILAPATGFAEPSVAELQQQIETLQQQLNQIQTMQQQLKEVEKLKGDVEELYDIAESNEKKVASDRISWYGDLRVKADTLHYHDVTASQGVFFDFEDFGQRAFTGEFGNLDSFGMPTDPTSPIAKFMTSYPTQSMQWATGGYRPQDYFVIATPQKSDINNDILYTTRLRLGMKAKVYDNVSFSGRLLMYKNWGDSTGSKVFDSWDAFTMDGTNSGNTTGDFLHVERAYFDWKNIGGTHTYLSIGRRPSTYGPPGQYRENELRGGTPSGHLVNFNFDGITLGYKLSAITGVEGQTLRFCYGQGFESEYGNGELFNQIETKDVHLGGLNIDAINDGTNFLQFTLFRAIDVTDGFKGTLAFPTQFAAQLAPNMYQDLQNFPNFNFVTRYQPSTNIGDITLGGVGFSREEDNGVNWFTSFGWTRAEPNGKAGLFGGMLSDPVYQAALVDDPNGGQMIVPQVTSSPSADKNRDGYSLYAGIQSPAPMGKIGFEYNYGSQYWTPFTQAQDDVIGSKLATRGHVGEAYYIFDVNPNTFIKLGGIYYDYEYTGSGSPVGAPVKIKDVQDGKAASLLPAIDTAWDAYLSLTIHF